jgi:hypothetical protein
MGTPQDIQAVVKASRIGRRPRRLPRPPQNALPKMMFRKYANRLIDLIERWKDATKRIVFPHLAGIEKTVRLERPAVVRDSWPDDLSQQMNVLRSEFDRLSRQSSELAYGTFNEVNGLSRSRWYKIAHAVMGVDLVAGEPWLDAEARAFVAQNISLINKLSQETAADIEQILMDGFRKGRRIESMQEQILTTDLAPTAYEQGGKKVFLNVENRAELIARDQTAKLWGNINQLRQTNVGVDMYTWRTVRDERVVGNPSGKYPNPTEMHKNHWLMDGKICKWNDVTVYAETVEEAMAGKWKERTADMPKAHPGEEINCRCFASPVFETFFAEAREAA